MPGTFGKYLYPARDIHREAVVATEAPAPPDGSAYPFLHQLGKDLDAQLQDHDPFEEEKRNSVALFIVSVIAAILAPIALGLTNLAAGVILIGFFTAVLSGHAAWFKAWPTDVKPKTILHARQQLFEAAEGGQRLGTPLGQGAYAILCLADGSLTATALAERLGQAALTPTMARIVGLIVSIILAAALFVLVKAAAREGTKQDARKTIRSLHISNPVHAALMERRVGGALAYAYGTRDDSIRARSSLIALVVFLAITQFALRAGSFSGEETSTLDTLFNWIAATAVSTLVVFTVGGMYVSERRHTFLDPDSPTSKLILNKFPNETTLEKHRVRHELRWRRIAQNTARYFSARFKEERSAAHLAKDHPLPSF